MIFTYVSIVTEYLNFAAFVPQSGNETWTFTFGTTFLVASNKPWYKTKYIVKMYGYSVFRMDYVTLLLCPKCTVSWSTLMNSFLPLGTSACELHIWLTDRSFFRLRSFFIHSSAVAVTQTNLLSKNPYVSPRSTYHVEQLEAYNLSGVVSFAYRPVKSAFVIIQQCGDTTPRACKRRRKLRD